HPDTVGANPKHPQMDVPFHRLLNDHRIMLMATRFQSGRVFDQMRLVPGSVRTHSHHRIGKRAEDRRLLLLPIIETSNRVRHPGAGEEELLQNAGTPKVIGGVSWKGGYP